MRVIISCSLFLMSCGRLETSILEPKTTFSQSSTNPNAPGTVQELISEDAPTPAPTICLAGMKVIVVGSCGQQGGW